MVLREVFPRSPEWIEIGMVAASGGSGIGTRIAIKAGEIEAGSGVGVGAIENEIVITRPAVTRTVSVKLS
ncbi:hypothetical protein AA309_02960 [Microvirga vignae]|uniref:Uncharacterized protein n=1 Tax=Microvirga vignae TaxID=1225564 RepID=A0A0H1RPF1_9HYPH|nr:hypothetical protein AA309_02960 [Microvirga vignae]